MTHSAGLHCVLFDLDGTLLDTAPDLIACLQEALALHHYPPITSEHLKPFISFGALAMIKNTLPTLSESQQHALLDTMLTQYEQNIARHTRFFAGMEQVLAWIEQRGVPWGIITNKRQRFTQPLLAELQLTHRAACVISGDSTPYSKPHVEPMLTACRQIAVEPSACVYIGDARHDITAGKQAGMQTLVALYGYLHADDQPETWLADGMISSPEALLSWLSARLA